ncbi:piggyBac transposable element-derived protein 3-like [Melanotaenia boesemani]|uniref:piggyBac transposable element-derived protein 3-like n=1 Tax=Melanotaenia boesemani TaxID=1250792 RepID=UPI001C041569|nr:piggyBac transposable element-derived protein 3-like [Melanotaenia boesemani]XP_041836537.1 piggyBac transposable element-derived protein 3-like [Melanotaenia boesemani]
MTVCKVVQLGEKITSLKIREGRNEMDQRGLPGLCTIHPAFTGEVFKRRVKEKEGSCVVKNISCPTPIIAYNKNMGGVDLSNQLLQYYSTHHKTACWYCTLLLHLVDIASTNAYILHYILLASQTKPMSHKDFQTELVTKLCGVDSTCMPSNRSTNHIPVAIARVTDPSLKATQGPRICQRCHRVDKKRYLTPWKCQSCDVALCLVLDRNYFAEWHR